MPMRPVLTIMKLEKQTSARTENEERGNWSGKLDFLLSCLGYAVGLGNVWRFPYKCYSNGGGAFFIPYVIMLIFVGMPLFFMELALGQYTSNGPLTCWKYAPMFTGVGYGMVIVSGFVGIYYNIIIAWSLYYLFASFTSHVPWQDCDREWNNQYCYKLIPDTNCTDSLLYKHPNGTCFNVTSNYKLVGLWNDTLAEQNEGIRRQLPSEQYYQNYVLGLSDGVEQLGTIKWQLALCLLLAWVIVFLSLCKGVKSSGKVVYFTALFPYVVLVILLVRGITQDGYYEGILYYVTPEWHRLTDAKVWNDAANQIFFSLSASWGGLITLSSYNRFHNNCLRDTLIVTISNCLTSIFAGFVIFSFLGFMAKELNTGVDKVVKGGTGLAFVVYPEALSRMPVAPLWAILFFVMLLTLGLDSQFALLETVTTSLMDRWPHHFTRKKKTVVILAVCVCFYLLGLLLCTNAGGYILELMDSYAGGWAVLLIGLCECLSIIFVYGWQNFSSDIGLMLGSKPSVWWRLCWSFLSPAIILFVLIFSWVDYSPAKYGDTYVFPRYANIIGWCITVIIVLPIPIGMMYYLFCRRSDRPPYRPDVRWGPALVKHRQLVTHLPNFVVDPDQPEGSFGMQPQPHKITGPGDLGDGLEPHDNPVFEPERY